MKKDIVFLTESMVGAGGVVRVITTWANYFSTHGYKCKIISVVKGEPYFPLHEGIQFKIKTFFFKWKLLSLPLNLLAIIPILKECKNSILVVNKSASTICCGCLTIRPASIGYLKLPGRKR